MKEKKSVFMNSLMKITDKIAGPLTKFANLPSISAIQEGMLGIMSTMIVGSGFILLYSIADPEMMGGNALLPFLTPYLDQIYLAYTMTTGFLALYASLTVSMAYAEKIGVDIKNAAVLGLTTFLFITVGQFADPEWGSILIEGFSAGGLFTALISSIIVVRIYHFCESKQMMIKMPAGVPVSVIKSFAAIIPFLICVIAAWLIRSILGFDLNMKLFGLMEPLISAADNIFSYTGLTTLMQTFWCAGLHGDLIVYSFYAPLLTMWDTANATAFAMNETLPYIWTTGFEYMGASYFPLIFLMWKSPVKQFNAVAKIAAPALVFNITEPILFGLPIALNPFLIIPCILGTVVDCLIKYGATMLGFVDRFRITLPWCTPPIIGSPLSTGDFRTIILIIVQFCIGLLIYYPFFKAYERQKLAEQEDLLCSEEAQA
ncbi:MAG: PTS transporter subunit EIIC [Clostridium sp.]|uniref:PTS sugar transporter subunit IIC n=1 Tax=Clostridium sp. TaxID=1506 RepID=UPI0029069FD8|nr:PTS transporter subunit EIIC [Clostridium sp.]MDU5111006.1 PTS transporter subunit EIIC [Clostridium sp.]